MRLTLFNYYDPKIMSIAFSAFPAAAINAFGSLDRNLAHDLR